MSQYDQGQAGYEEGQRQYQAAQQQYQEALAQYQLLEQQAAALPEDSPELPVLQLRGKRGVLRLELVLALLQRIDDLYQFSAVHPPQFTICHLRTNSRM